MGFSNDPCCIQNHVIKNHVIKRLVCIRKIVNKGSSDRIAGYTYNNTNFVNSTCYMYVNKISVNV